ncbi:MAG: hypothetical protein AAF950_11780 [Pseudomonadota bacterium]
MSTEKFKNAPSLQHLVRMIRPTAVKTANAILAPKPRKNIWKARDYVFAVLSGMSPEQAIANAMSDSRTDIRKTALETIPLIEQYFIDHDFGWFRRIDPIVHQVSPSVSIPIKPMGVAKVDGKIVILWPQLWKTISLTPEQFNIIASYLKLGILDKFPDYEDFHWLEMSVPKGKKERELRVRTIETAQLLAPEELRRIEKVIEEALLIASKAPTKPEKPAKPKDPDQGFLL